MTDKKTLENARIGHGKPGPGRPKGAVNKTTASIKNALCDAFEKHGGVRSLVSWAKENETEFYKLWARLAPAEVELAGKDGGPVIVRVRVEREGRRVTAG